MTEQELAENICRIHAQGLVDRAGGITLSGNGIAEQYMSVFGRNQYASECADALRHWVQSAGYDEHGKFKYIISKHIINC